jgi:hypothetical protein
MSDGRWTIDDGRGIGRIAAVVAAASIVLVLGGAVIRSWVSRNRVIEGQGYEGVIFNQVHTASILGPMLSADAGGFWTPTDSDVGALERALATTVQGHAPEGLGPLDQYTRQYFGYRREGRRQILVVGFCNAHGLDWTRTFVSAGEGGCHFEATYDTTSDRVANLWALDPVELFGSAESRASDESRIA